ncbi:hypothetical protein MATR_01740 [Marivirga tractuosa]|uniref:Uncharacterized protein n=1 Tax=Marivirga tractuosa (strain ATCC 23168 / DSM 4126 / NBRC 15989 / NCIMB 1408 / VKM B-1430 / H-43) TaxID=643867 RepID=E4TVT9_MARTH|nr:hypothetical protein [Marivirga tractuosa]ADR22187.1 hypothetical protein Ftrac_2205 [Marivirga tractuosa DSM 4126]BDD13349.1 hypothetical protein MATR_01740 [Marivirga tractuosa]
MKILKQKTNIIYLFFLISTQGFAQETNNEIDLKKVRETILESGNYMFPKSFIENLELDKYKTFYFDDNCLVHIPYKNREAKSWEKLSLICLFKKSGTTWQFHSIFPYYYDLKKIKESSHLFMSTNLFCEPDGSCNKFVVVSLFKDNTLSDLIKERGFNNELYLQRLQVFNHISQVKTYQGDTICNLPSLSALDFYNSSLKSYTVERKIMILEKVTQDSLTIKKFLDEEFIKE